MHYCYSGVSKRRSVEASVGSWYIHVRDADRIVHLAKLEAGIVVVVNAVVAACVRSLVAD